MASGVLIAGLGNWLMRDDGVGVHAVRALQPSPPSGATLLEIGTAVLDSLDAIESAEVILALDAIQAGGAPGTIYRQDPATRTQVSLGSSHEIDLFDAVAMIQDLRRPSVIAVGIEPACIDYGIELSEPVRAAFPDYLRIIRETVASIVEDREG